MGLRYILNVRGALMEFITKSSQKTVANNFLKIFGLVLFMLLAALFSAAVIIIGGPKYTLMLGGGFVCLLFFVLPPQWLLSALIAYVYLIYGPLNYFTSIDTTWVPYLMGLGLLFMAFILRITGKNTVNNSNYQKRKPPLYIWSLLILYSVAIFSTATGFPSAFPLLISIRGMLFIWGVYFILSDSSFKPAYFRNVWLFLTMVGLLQIPMAIYQRVAVVSTRTDTAVWDSVIGTFMGTETAGDSGGMAFFLLAIITMAVSLWRHSQLSSQRTLLLICLLILPILLAEVKIVYLLIPIMTFLIFRSEFKLNPIKFIGGILLACVLVISVFVAGKYFNHSQDSLSHGINWEAEYVDTFAFSTNLDVYNKGGEMGRMTGLAFWWRKNKDEPLRLILGHGLGSTYTDGHNFGSEARKFRPLIFGNTIAAVMLWDSGILGLLAYVGILFFGALRASQLAKLKTTPPFHQAMLFSASIIIWSSLLLLPYNNGSVTTQVFLVLLLGMVEFWNKQIRIIDTI